MCAHQRSPSAAKSAANRAAAANKRKVGFIRALIYIEVPWWVMNVRDRIAATYNAAADRHGHPSLTHWDYFGGRTVARLALRGGECVLDVCCGAGASALPAARAVGPAGRVIGIDLAETSLKLARGRVANEGLTNVEFRHADFDRVYF